MKMNRKLIEEIYPVRTPSTLVGGRDTIARRSTILPRARLHSTRSNGVYASARKIPRGRVATYSDIARAVGRPRAWRHVGTVLSFNRDPGTPCHRVIRSDGLVGGFGLPGGNAAKQKRLKEEGVEIKNGRVDLLRFGIKKL